MPIFILFVTLTLSGNSFAGVDGLPQAVSQAQQLLAAPSLDSDTGESAAADLLRLIDRYPESPLLPEALLLAARLEAATGHRDAALTLARRIIENHPHAPEAPRAFDIAWNLLTDEGQSPLTGAEFAEAFAASQGNTVAAARAYNLAFEAYRDANQWQNAVTVGRQFAAQCVPAPADAPFLLALGEAALAAGDTPFAQQILESLTARFDKLPAAIPARVQLATIYAAAGDKARAQEHYALAWTSFQKQRPSANFADPGVSRAAARALWELQAAPKRELERLAQIGSPADESLIRAEADDLLKAYSEVRKTDPTLAPQVLAATADIHAAVGDALLAVGFQRALGEIGATRRAPYQAALREYGEAVALYTESYGHAARDAGSAEARQLAKRASERAFELTAGEGDAVFAWALELSRMAPEVAPGTEGNLARIEYLSETVTPLLEEGLGYKSQALALASTMPLSREAEILRRSLDVPLRPVAGELYALCREQLQTAAASSAELASTFSFGLQTASSVPLAETAQQNFDRATALAGTLQDALNRLYTPLDQAYLPVAALAFWDSLAASAYYDYAAVCRTYQDNLSVCLAGLKSRTDETAVTLKKRLGKLQKAGATEELAGLVRWHTFARGHDVEHPLAAKLSARLSELDPDTYGSADDLPSASRKKP